MIRLSAGSGVLQDCLARPAKQKQHLQDASVTNKTETTKGFENEADLTRTPH